MDGWTNVCIANSREFTAEYFLIIPADSGQSDAKSVLVYHWKKKGKNRGIFTKNKLLNVALKKKSKFTPRKSLNEVRYVPNEGVRFGKSTALFSCLEGGLL